ncbi:MAG: cell division protein ZapA [Alphaproteobacteria bacterium]|jgi:cell division protein ZapA|nr:cell division protein ZapA [Alphaproteobacteria bacterium]MBT4084482.1 cell division protein ZapA [Alphaproteobacteria bacterium]MBT4545711.1 cell division protein ZapA [Alphaproteobacteria bacterium]MBT7744314.1 cell division protein ZapA [Alphaproteobacteria bacterium]
MAQVQVTVNGRNYTLVCDDGEEEHLTSLAATVDGKVSELVTGVGQIGEGRLLLMAGLLMADERVGSAERIAELEEELAAARAAVSIATDNVNEDASQAMIEAAKRIEDVAVQLQSA